MSSESQFELVNYKDMHTHAFKNMILALKDVCCGTGATSNTVTCPNVHSVHFIIHNSDVGCGPKAGQFLHSGSSHSDGVVVH